MYYNYPYSIGAVSDTQQDLSQARQLLVWSQTSPWLPNPLLTVKPSYLSTNTDSVIVSDFQNIISLGVIQDMFH